MFHGFENLHFTKSGADIITKSKEKKEKLEARVSDKEARLKEMCEENELSTMEILTQELDAYITSNTGKMRSDDVGKLTILARQVRDAKDEGKKLTAIINNLNPETNFDLNFGELRYFGF